MKTCHAGSVTESLQCVTPTLVQQCCFSAVLTCTMQARRRCSNSFSPSSASPPPTPLAKASALPSPPGLPCGVAAGVEPPDLSAGGAAAAICCSAADAELAAAGASAAAAAAAAGTMMLR